MSFARWLVPGLLAAGLRAAAAHVVPGAVVPQWPQSWALRNSTLAMVCNASGRVDPAWAAQWGAVDLDWNGNKKNWSAAKPMDTEEDMVANMAAVKAINPATSTWVYRNGCKVRLPGATGGTREIAHAQLTHAQLSRTCAHAHALSRAPSLPSSPTRRRRRRRRHLRRPTARAFRPCLVPLPRALASRPLARAACRRCPGTRRCGGCWRTARCGVCSCRWRGACRRPASTSAGPMRRRICIMTFSRPRPETVEKASNAARKSRTGQRQRAGLRATLFAAVALADGGTVDRGSPRHAATSTMISA